MTHRWLTRTLVAVAVPALLVPAVASSSAAAPQPPAVPTLDAVAKIYPHLDGASAMVMRERKIRMPGESCKRGPVITGAVGRASLYASDTSSLEDLESTGEEPMVSVRAEVFPTARLAGQYLQASPELTGLECELPDGVELQIKKIRFRLGSERSGFQVRVGRKKDPLMIANFLVVRSGKMLVAVSSVSSTGKVAPSVAKSVELTRLALKTAG